MHHVSAERGGELTVLVTGEEEAARAAAIFEAQGYRADLQPVLDT